MGRKSREKRDRRTLKQELQGIEEVGPFDWPRMEALTNRIKQHRRDNPDLFYCSFEPLADGIESGEAQDGRPIG